MTAAVLTAALFGVALCVLIPWALPRAAARLDDHDARRIARTVDPAADFIGTRAANEAWMAHEAEDVIAEATRLTRGAAA